MILEVFFEPMKKVPFSVLFMTFFALLASGCNTNSHPTAAVPIGEQTGSHAPVWCAWMAYNQVKGIFDICAPHDDQAFKGKLDNALDDINDFIVANSTAPVTKTELESRMKEGQAQMHAMSSKLTAAELHKKCTTGDWGRVINGVRTWPDGKLEADIAELLSVPRPPELNPCF